MRTMGSAEVVELPPGSQFLVEINIIGVREKAGKTPPGRSGVTSRPCH